MRVLRLDHLVLAVQELRQAADAWERTFGLRAEAPFRPEGSHMELAVLPVGGPSEHDAFLELVAVAGEPALSGVERVARHLEQQGEGMFSISIEVDDLDAAVAELRANGVTVSGPEEGVLPNSRVARIPRAEAFGVAIQLIQRVRS